MSGPSLLGLTNERQEAPDKSSERPPPVGWAPIRYFREATRIARLDVEAIARVSRDKNALFYGACILAVGALLIYLTSLPVSGEVPLWLVVVVGVVAVLLQLPMSAFNIAVVHGLARFLLAATGSYVSLLRVLWLGSVVLWLSVIPFIGMVVGSLWFLLVTMVTFEEVDGVERLQALALSLGFAAIMWVVQVSILA